MTRPFRNWETMTHWVKNSPDRIVVVGPRRHLFIGVFGLLQLEYAASNYN
jgi:hypothetical protein